MIEFSLTREHASLVLNSLRLYSYSLEIAEQSTMQDDADAVYDIINAKLHPEYGAPILQPEGCLT